MTRSKWSISLCIAFLFSTLVQSRPGAPVAAQEPKPHKQVGVDFYGDPLPAGVSARMGTVRLRQGEWTGSIVLSPNGKTLASSDDSSVCLWDVTTGRLLNRFSGPRHSYRTLAFTPDGTNLVAMEIARPQSNLRRWDVATGKELPKLKTAHGGSLVAFTSDGKRLLGKGDKAIYLWDAATGTQIQQFQPPTDPVGSVALSRDGKTVAATGYSSSFKVSTSVYLWDVATGKQHRSLDGHEAGASCVAFAPDGTTLLAADEKHIFRWDWAGGKLLGRTPRAGGRSPAVFSPDGTVLAAEDFYLNTLWDVGAGNKVCDLEFPKGSGAGGTIGGYRFAFSPDGKIVAKRSYNNLILLWETATGKLLHRYEAHANAVEHVAVAPDGQTLASSARQEGESFVWELATGKPLFRVPHRATGFVQTPVGPALVTADNKLGLWEAATGKEVLGFPMVFDKAEGHVACLAIAADGRSVAAGHRDGRVSFWDLKTGKRLRQFQVHPIRVDPDGVRSAASVSPLVLAPDGRTFVCGNDYDQITVVNAATGKLLHQFRSRPVARCLVVSPDGKTLASTGPSNAQVIQLWELATGKERLQVGDKCDAFHALAFSADGRTLISGGADATIRFWDTATGKEVGRLPGHYEPVTALALLPNGQGFVSGSADSTLLVWHNIPRRSENRLLSLTVPELEALWTDLAGEDAAKAYRAIHRLVTAGAQAVSFLTPRLSPVVPPDPRQLAQWIAELDDDNFTIRQKASAALEKLGDVAGPALRKALDDKPSLEAQRRVERVLALVDELSMPAATLRVWRALETLEAIGNPEARRVLEKMAAGAAGARITQGAADALGRLDRLTGGN